MGQFLNSGLPPKKSEMYISVKCPKVTPPPICGAPQWLLFGLTKPGDPSTDKINSFSILMLCSIVVYLPQLSLVCFKASWEKTGVCGRAFIPLLWPHVSLTCLGPRTIFLVRSQRVSANGAFVPAPTLCPGTILIVFMSSVKNIAAKALASLFIGFVISHTPDSDVE